MNDEIPAIEVRVVRDSHLASPPTDAISIPVARIASTSDATPPGPFQRGQFRCKIVLIVLVEAPVELEPWVFRNDADVPSKPRELLVSETLMQVSALIESAQRNSRSVAVEDLGREVAAGMMRPAGVKPMRVLRTTPRARPLPEV